MTTVYRQLIESTLQTMEPGIFQDFSLDFLPVYEDRFIGLERFGHTAAGKTRAGTPDLIKTDSSGRQIAVQCSTAADYWGSVESIDGLKGYSDAVKCIEELANLSEIVLMSNREIPTGIPNIKADIILSLREKTGATITLTSIGEIGQFLSGSLHEPKTKVVVLKYFPEVASALEAEEESQRYRLALSVVGDRVVDARILLELAEQALTVYPQLEEARQYVVERLDSLSRCCLSAVPTFEGVTRGSVDTLSLRLPLGGVFVLAGVPKIGKTSLLLQLARSWTEYIVKWFDIPIEGSEGCSEEISRYLIKAVLPDEDVGQLLRSPVLLASKLKYARRSSTPVVFIVDNANHLPDVGLRHLCEVFAVLKRHGLMVSIGCIFSTNRRLTGLSTIAEFVAAPEWTPSELAQLLEVSGLNPPGSKHPDEYLELLAAVSGSHPLVAIALARRHSTIGGLITNRLMAKPTLGDEMLSHEVQVLLYEDLLTDADSQNLVHRLSVLFDRVPPDILEVLRSGVYPQIATPMAVLIDRLHGSVIEGDRENGYSVPFVFREIAKHKIAKEEMQAVYTVVSDRLLQPEGNVVGAERITSGIVYAIFSVQLEKALFWTGLLLRKALNKPVTNEQLSVLLSRLIIVSTVKRPADLWGQFVHASAIVTFAAGYSRLGEYAKAASVLACVELDKAPASGREDLVKDFYLIRFTAACYRALCMLMANSGNALDVLAEIGPGELGQASGEQWSTFLDLLRYAVVRYSLTDRSRTLIRDVLTRIEPERQNDREYGLQLATSIGGRAKENSLDPEFVNGFFPSTPFGELLQHASSGVLLTETGETGRAVLELDRSITMGLDQGVNSGNFWARLQLLKGDAAYKDGANDLAEIAYLESIQAANLCSFEQGWSSWRIGLLREDEHALALAAEAFRQVGIHEFWARAWGARGALLIKAGKRSEGLRCFAELVEKYYIGKEDVIGPGVAIAQSHAMRLNAELESRPIPETDEQFPPFTAEVYEIVLPTARPRAGPVVSFFVLSETYRLLNEHDMGLYWINRSMELVPEDELDRRSYPIVIKSCLESLSYSIDDSPRIRKCVDHLLKYQSLNVEIPKEMLFYSVFAQADKLLHDRQETANFSLFLDIVQEAVAEHGMNRNSWEAEVFVRRAAVARVVGSETVEVVRLYKCALEKANECENGSVMVVSGHALGFELIELTGSLREAASYQFAIIRGIALQGSGYEQLDTVGANLYTVWTGYTYRRLSEHDLKAKRFLMDSARELKGAHVPKEEAQRVMVLLLAKLFEYSSAPVEWVRKGLCLQVDSLPASVRELLIDR